MLIGVIGLLLPNRTAGWLGRRLLVRRSYPSGRVERIPVPPYVARNPGASALERGPAVPADPARPGSDLIEDAESGYDVIQETEPQGDRYRRHEPARAGARRRPQPAARTEVIEDLYEQP